MAQRELTDRQMQELAVDIVDIFEHLLEKKGLWVPDDDRQSNNIAEADELGEARLYGMTYGELQSSIEGLLEVYLIDDSIKDEFGGTHEEGLGWNPDGEFCGECGSGTCVGCPGSNRPLAIKLIEKEK